MPWADGTTGSRTASQLESADRTYARLVANSIHVADYGAVGDGSTDDSGAIQDAIDACAAAGTGEVLFGVGNYHCHTGLTLPTGVHLVGQGSEATTITKGADIVLLDHSGADSANHVHRGGLRYLSLHGGGNASWNETILRAYYADVMRCHDVIFKMNVGPAIEGVEFWDSLFTGCRLDNLSTTDGSYLAAVRLLSRTAPAGFGYSADSVNNIHFVDCWWETFSDAAIDINQNGGAQLPNLITFRDCKFETNAATAEPINVYGGNDIHFENCYGYMGGAAGLAKDFMYFSTMQHSSIDLRLTAANVNDVVRAGVSFRGNCQGTILKRVVGTFPQKPTVALVEFSGASNTVRVSKDVYYQQNTESGAVFSGCPDIPWELEDSGSPEGVVYGQIGSRYWNTAGGASTTLYVKTSGAGTNTGWTAK